MKIPFTYHTYNKVIHIHLAGGVSPIYQNNIPWRSKMYDMYRI